MKFSKILVPILGLPVDDDAIRLACQIARQDKAKVLVINVIEVERALPLEAQSTPQVQHAELALERAEQAAKQIWSQVESDLLQARAAGPALVDEAAERGVDLIIMSVPYRKHLGEFHLGTTTMYVLKNAPCRVWLCRQPFGPTPATKPAGEIKEASPIEK